MSAPLDYATVNVLLSLGALLGALICLGIVIDNARSIRRRQARIEKALQEIEREIRRITGDDAVTPDNAQEAG